jgi:hypothetical protein
MPTILLERISRNPSHRQKDRLIPTAHNGYIPLALGACLTACIASTAFGSVAPTADKCKQPLKLSRPINDKAFSLDCTAGEPQQVAQVMTRLRARYNQRQRCEALSEQSGAGHRDGWRKHQIFMSKCMSGKLKSNGPEVR